MHFRHLALKMLDHSQLTSNHKYTILEDFSLREWLYWFYYQRSYCICQYAYNLRIHTDRDYLQQRHLQVDSGMRATLLGM